VYREPGGNSQAQSAGLSPGRGSTVCAESHWIAVLPLVPHSAPLNITLDFLGVAAHRALSLVSAVKSSVVLPPASKHGISGSSWWRWWRWRRKHHGNPLLKVTLDVQSLAELPQ
jgi:hypothetical protein